MIRSAATHPTNNRTREKAFVAIYVIAASKEFMAG
jgi:hypothetical protein